MELPLTKSGNRYATVLQDFLSKWPFVFAAPDQKDGGANRLVHLLTREIVPVFGVPDTLLSDCGTNLLSHIMRDVCKLLGTTKLNTTAYHPQRDRMVERMNRTLKAMLRQYTAVWQTVGPVPARCPVGISQYTPRLYFGGTVVLVAWGGSLLPYRSRTAASS